jgi:hypothetical protein
MWSEPRAKWPSKPLGHADDPLSYRCWMHSPSYAEDPKPWKCVAAFRGLTDALRWIAGCQDAGLDVVFQSPAECKLITAMEARAVFQQEGVSP